MRCLRLNTIKSEVTRTMILVQSLCLSKQTCLNDKLKFGSEKGNSMVSSIESFVIQDVVSFYKYQGKPTKLDKFCETGWRCLYYSGVTLYGVWCLWDKPWLWNIRNCWYGSQALKSQSYNNQCLTLIVRSIALYFNLFYFLFESINWSKFKSTTLECIIPTLLSLVQWPFKVISIQPN